MYRAEGLTWFPEEMPCREEYEEGWKNLEKMILGLVILLRVQVPAKLLHRRDMANCQMKR